MVRKIGKDYLVTLDHGSWITMGEQEYKMLNRRKMPESQIKKYEEEGLLITKKSVKEIEEKYRRRYHFLGKPPGLHIIIPTLRCNMACDYCHSEAKGQDSNGCDMNTETASKVVDFILANENKELYIEFQGGEPLLNFKVIKHIIEDVRSKNKSNKKINYILVTNLTLLNDEHLAFIQDNKIRLSTSIDGPAKLHDKHRRFLSGNGSHASVISAIDKLKKNKIPVGMLLTTTKDSLPHPEEIVDEYVRLGAQIIQLKPINWIGRGKESQRYTAEEFIEYWTKSVDYMIRLNKKGVQISERTATVLLKKILTDYDPNFLDIRSPCGAVIGQLLYDQKGDIYSCDDGKIFEIFKVGSVEDENYHNLLGKSNARAIIAASINGNYLCYSCAYKPYCGTCPVANYAEDGTAIPKLYKNFRCKIRKAQFDYLFGKIINSPDESEMLKKWALIT
jgi:His-Xaa-Ser system radical SAM maturase HxsB